MMPGLMCSGLFGHFVLLGETRTEESDRQCVHVTKGSFCVMKDGRAASGVWAEYLDSTFVRREWPAIGKPCSMLRFTSLLLAAWFTLKLSICPISVAWNRSLCSRDGWNCPRSSTTTTVKVSSPRTRRPSRRCYRSPVDRRYFDSCSRPCIRQRRRLPGHSRNPATSPAVAKKTAWNRGRGEEDHRRPGPSRDSTLRRRRLPHHRHPIVARRPSGRRVAGRCRCRSTPSTRSTQARRRRRRQRARRSSRCRRCRR